LIAKVDGADPAASPLASFLAEAGFLPGSRGYLIRAAPRTEEARVAADA